MKTKALLCLFLIVSVLLMSACNIGGIIPTPDPDPTPDSDLTPDPDPTPTPDGGNSSLEYTEGLEFGYFSTRGGDYYGVVGYHGTATDIVIPATQSLDEPDYGGSDLDPILIEDQFVCGIAPGAFQGSNITSVTFLSGGDTAVALSEVNTWTIEIGENAFRSCDRLQSVVFPEIRDDELQDIKIRDGAFRDCRVLKDVRLSEHVRICIGTAAFSDCSSLTGITLPDGVAEIGSRAFANCSLKSISLSCTPDVNSDAFEGNKDLIREDNLVRYVGDENNPYAILVGVTTAKIKNLCIHEDTKVIAKSAFADCAALTGITVPASVCKIGAYAFLGCESLEWIYFEKPYGWYANQYGDVGSVRQDFFVHDFVAPARVAAMLVDECVGYDFWRSGWREDADDLTVPTEGIIYGISADGTYAEVLDYMGNSWTIVIADTYQGLPVRVICEYAFACLGENSSMFDESAAVVVIPDSVTTICEGAFYGCVNLVELKLGHGVREIGKEAFSGCGALIDLTLPEGLESIGDYAFRGSANLPRVVIPESVISIGTEAFHTLTEVIEASAPKD